jgi:hypothetical protein
MILFFGLQTFGQNNSPSDQSTEQVVIKTQSGIEVSLIKDANSDDIYNVKFTSSNEQTVEFDYSIINEKTGETYYSCSSVQLDPGYTYFANDGTLTQEIYDVNEPYMSNSSMLPIVINNPNDLTNYSVVMNIK